MPPQPISLIKPGITYNIKPGSFDERPHVAQAISECINAWSNVDSAMGWLFVSLLQTNETRGAELYATLESGKAKRDAINALAVSALSDEDRAIVLAVLKYSKSQQKIRDKIAHWVWGVSPELDDAMILIDPKEQLNGIGFLTMFLKAVATKTSSDLFEKIEDRMKPANIYAYTVNSLRADRDCFIELQDMVKEVGVLALSRELAKDEHDKLYQKLAHDARLAEFLGR